MPLTGEYEPSTMDFSRKQVEQIESSGGTEGVSMQGLSVIVLTTVGRKSGKLRKAPLMRVEHDGVYAAVASLGGAPKNPVWYLNALADQRVEVRDGEQVFDMIAREATGDEREVWWKRSVEAFPPYAEYQEKTDRQIPVLLLEPAPAPH
ncbi:nitroreductase family deazaflavin-dependent oxidoreductase [Amycolatopsis endophytica]|uniref:Deazaflavin-dependent oxidoreductase (Nitroreductase family) n=1 Tax=Amycolatopsis endophytica TaxID=860233 RepID=A0A853B949_9PSEU|nr:nitroreductase family deazaflavin-dependent oxidoreductase [Amycolatopsis endophytica]NYI91294.1 deazaflavin-dependent oxidoreductase (nitroreductase family) [Amycolatopsis endophytica]